MNNIFISSSCFKERNYEILFEQCLKNKLFNIELTGVHSYLQEKKFIELLKSYKKKGLNFTFHNYFPIPKKEFVFNFLSKNKTIKLRSTNLILNALNIMKSSKVNVYTFHPGYYRDAMIKKNGHFKFYGKKNNDFIQNLNLFNKRIENLKNNIKKNHIIGIENLFPNSDSTCDSFMCTFEEINNIFKSRAIKKNKIGLLIDLGHLAISAKLLNFDKYDFLLKVIKLYKNRIIEVHVSENDHINDLHLPVHNKSWQLNALKFFKNTNYFGRKTIFTLEARSIDIKMIKNNIALIKKNL